MEILTYPHDSLKIVAKNVSDYHEAHKIASEMHVALAECETSGIGIAAPQVGIDARIIIIDTRGQIDGLLLYMFNPKIVGKSKNRATGNEGCLSFPGETVPVDRFTKLKVRYKDAHGAKHVVSLHGLNAVVAQHEIDHLDGITLADHKDPLPLNLKV